MQKKFLLVSLVSGLLALSGCGTTGIFTSTNSSSTTSPTNSTSPVMASTSSAAITTSSSKLTIGQQAFLKKYHLAEPTGLRPMETFKMNDVSEGDEGNFDSIVCGYLSPGPEYSAGEFGNGGSYQCAFLNAVDVYDREVKEALGKETKIALVDGIYDKAHPNRLAFSLSDVTQEQLQLFSTLYSATRQKPVCVKISFGVPGGADGVCSGTAIKLEPVTSASYSRQ